MKFQQALKSTIRSFRWLFNLTTQCPYAPTPRTPRISRSKCILALPPPLGRLWAATSCLTFKYHPSNKLSWKTAENGFLSALQSNSKSIFSRSIALIAATREDWLDRTLLSKKILDTTAMSKDTTKGRRVTGEWGVVRYPGRGVAPIWRSNFGIPKDRDVREFCY